MKLLVKVVVQQVKVLMVDKEQMLHQLQVLVVEVLVKQVHHKQVQKVEMAEMELLHQ